MLYQTRALEAQVKAQVLAGGRGLGHFKAGLRLSCPCMFTISILCCMSSGVVALLVDDLDVVSRIGGLMMIACLLPERVLWKSVRDQSLAGSGAAMDPVAMTQRGCAPQLALDGAIEDPRGGCPADKL